MILLGGTLLSGGQLIKEINGIPIAELRRDRGNRMLAFPRCQLRAPEVGIICSLILELQEFGVFIRALDVSGNVVDSDCLSRVVDCMEAAPHLQELDISFNPVTNGGSDLSGAQRLQRFMRHSQQVLRLEAAGIPGLAPILPPEAPPPKKSGMRGNSTALPLQPPQSLLLLLLLSAIIKPAPPPPSAAELQGALLHEQMSLSAMVNRSLQLQEEDRFTAFAALLVVQKFRRRREGVPGKGGDPHRPITAESEEEELEEEEMDEDTIPRIADYEFIRRNKLPLNGVKVTRDNRIVLHREASGGSQRFTF